jgi:phosphoserine phosphatase RsbU/P
MRILIAEDEVTSRALLGDTLRRYGHEVLETEGGREAWARFQESTPPRLAILDWVMPDLDGLELVKRIRSLGSHMPPYLIMLTGRDRKSDVILGLEAGADDYLAKPFHPGELRARVEVGCRILEMQDALDGKIEELRHALEEIRTLRGIIPICNWCKKVRDDAGFWQQVEEYLRERSDAEFSHSICPECALAFHPDLKISRA